MLSALEIEKRGLNVAVMEVCLSACAEYLLPPANELYFINRPLIGYHRNPLILKYLLYENAAKDLNFCKKIGDHNLYEMLSRNGKSTDAWEVTLDKLDLKYYRVDYKEEECPWSAYEFTNRYWFPNSIQLREIFGLEFSGDVCADDPMCFEPKLKYIFGNKGGQFVVGNEIIVINKVAEN